MSVPIETRVDNMVILHDDAVFLSPPPSIFDTDWLRENGFWRGSSQGRYQAHFLEYNGHEIVLRHFYRGGLIGRINRDKFLRLGAHKSRALREFKLLAMMRAKGLKVPRPLAARYAPCGLFYKADIITARIPAAVTLAEVLRERKLTDQQWFSIGGAIRKLHDHRVFHSDLNCRNIMIDADNVIWLIDFDKCSQRTTGGWEQGNLDRLERSLNKVTAEYPERNWTRDHWHILLEGYTSKNGSRTPAPII